MLMNDKKKKLRWQLPFLILLVIGTIYAIRSPHSNIPFQREEGAIFGTFYHVTYQCDSSLQKEIEAELRKVDALSLPSIKNRSLAESTGMRKLPPDSMFVHVFQLAKTISEHTYGAFDITVAPLVNAWGFGFKNGQDLTPAQIDSILSFVGFEKVALENGKIVKQDPR